jgi:hypothetical protein
MRRYPAALLALAALTVLAPGTSARSGGTYAVHVLPDPTADVSPYGGCGLADAYVAGSDVGGSGRVLKVRRGSTLTATLVAQANVFAGDVGLDWSLRVFDRDGHELARSSGPAWRTEVKVRRVPSQVVLRACNRRGHPDATVSWSTS